MRSWKSKFVLSILLAISFRGTALAAETTAADARHTLWRVTSEANSIYMMGSIHLLKKENYPLADVVEKAFGESQVLVMEMIPPADDDYMAQIMVLQKSMLGKDETLEGLIDKELYAKASAVASEVEIDMAAVQKFKPWFFALTLTLAKLHTLGFEPDLGLDIYFHGKAVEAGKEVVGLETFEYQIDLLNGLSQFDQDQLLRQTLKDLEIIEGEMERIVKAWTAGDTGTVNEIILKSFREYPVIFEQLITKRTKSWLPEVESLLKQGKKCMVVVGVGHMVGEEGLVELLKKKGYTVEQL